MAGSFQVEVAPRPVSARRYVAESPQATLVFAHGAGVGQAHPFMTAAAHGLSARGIDVVTFNFPYMEAARRAPDRPPVLEACFVAVVAAAREHGQRDLPLFIGGKSMGGRMATHVAAHNLERVQPLSGVVCFGYPLHPPGRPEQLRVAHLASITTPLLVVQGSRDDFGTPAELETHFAAVKGPHEIVAVDGGDHSFGVRRSVGRTNEDVMTQVLDATAAWVRAQLK